MTEQEQQQLWELRKDLDSGMRSFNVYRLVVVAVLMVFALSRYQALVSLDRVIRQLSENADAARLSEGLSVHAFLVRVDYGPLSDEAKKDIYSQVRSVAALVDDLDLSEGYFDRARQMSFASFLQQSAPSERELRIELPYLKQLALPSIVLLYIPAVLFALLLHERIALRRIRAVRQMMGEEGPSRLEPVVDWGGIVLGHGMLGVLDNAVCLSAWLTSLGIVLDLIRRGIMGPLAGPLHLAVVIGLHVAVVFVYRETRRDLEASAAKRGGRFAPPDPR